MAFFLILLVISYFLGWCVVVGGNDYVFQLYDLLKEKRSPENSRAIREMAAKAFTKQTRALIFGGAVGGFLFWLCTAVPSILRQTAELKSRYDDTIQD